MDRCRRARSGPAAPIASRTQASASAIAGRLHRVVVVSRDPVLRRFWVSQMVSEMGDWIGLLGIAALLYENTGLALAASASLAALYLPYLFAPLLVGWTAKIPPRTLLIGADFLRAALILLLLVPGLPAGRCWPWSFSPRCRRRSTRRPARPPFRSTPRTRRPARTPWSSSSRPSRRPACWGSWSAEPLWRWSASRRPSA